MSLRSAWLPMNATDCNGVGSTLQWHRHFKSSIRAIVELGNGNVSDFTFEFNLGIKLDLLNLTW
jgi:hypothetical protein